MGEEIENPFWWTDSGINMDRIENIKKQIEDDRTAALIGAGNNIFISRTDIEWLIDEIKRMEEKWELEQQSADAYFVKLLSAKKALEFYADISDEAFIRRRMITYKEWEVARKALEEIE